MESPWSGGLNSRKRIETNLHGQENSWRGLERGRGQSKAAIGGESAFIILLRAWTENRQRLRQPEQPTRAAAFDVQARAFQTLESKDER